MLSTNKFEEWLTGHWKTNADQVNEVLNDKLAFCFLIAWSILEPLCSDNSSHGGFAGQIGRIAGIVSKDDRINKLQSNAKYFYDRYQNPENFRRLMHHKTLKGAYKGDAYLTRIIKADSFDSLDVKQYVYLLLWVVFRYRNNIYHGNKIVETWSNYRDEIQKCIFCMQIIIDTLSDLQQSQTD